MAVRRHTRCEGMLREHAGAAEPGEEMSCSLAVLQMLLKRWTQALYRGAWQENERQYDHKVQQGMFWLDVKAGRGVIKHWISSARNSAIFVLESFQVPTGQSPKQLSLVASVLTLLQGGDWSKWPSNLQNSLVLGIDPPVWLLSSNIS